MEWRWKVPVVLLVVVAYLGSVGATSSVDLNWSDDLPIYLPLVKRMVQTGGMEEPFSLRRMSSYGGQTFLQGEVMAVGSESNGMLVDKGLALVVVLGLVWGMFGRGGKWRGWMVLGAGLLVVMVDVPRVNTQSQVTGVVLFLGLMRTLWCAGGGKAGADDFGAEHAQGPYPEHGTRGDGTRWAVLVGVVAAGLASLRMNYVPVAGLILVGAYGVRRDWKRGVVAVGCMVLLVLPWAVGLWESSRSLIYPLMLGNQGAEYSGMYTNAMTVGAKVMWVAGYFGYWKAAVLLVPVVLVFKRRLLGTGMPVYVGAIVGAAAVAWVFNTISDATLYRYTFPMLFAAAIGAVGLVLREGEWNWRTAVAAVWVVGMIGINVPGAVRNFSSDVKEVGAWNTRPRVFMPPGLVDAYVEAQKAIPAGEGVYVAVSVPSLLDFSRNRIYLGDELGVVGPAPGIPVFGGAEAVREYFVSKGIHYVMAVDFDSALGLYSRPVWERFRDAAGQPAGGDVIEHNLAPVVLKMEENIDALAGRGGGGRTQVFGPVRVIRLD